MRSSQAPVSPRQVSIGSSTVSLRVQHVAALTPTQQAGTFARQLRSSQSLVPSPLSSAPLKQLSCALSGPSQPYSPRPPASLIGLGPASRTTAPPSAAGEVPASKLVAGPPASPSSRASSPMHPERTQATKSTSAPPIDTSFRTRKRGAQNGTANGIAARDHSPIVPAGPETPIRKRVPS